MKRMPKTVFYIYVLFFIAISCKTSAPLPDNSSEKTKVQESFTQQIPDTDVSFEMISIPEGDFMMGSPESQQGRDTDEGPMKKVELDGFYMGKYDEELPIGFRATTIQEKTQWL